MINLRYDLVPDDAVRLGLIVLQADQSLERDMWRMLPPGAELLVTRVPSGLSVTPDSLAAMEGHLTGAAALFPQGARFAAVGYGCTSGTAQIGAAQVAQRVQAGVSCDAVTEPVSALIAACDALGVTRIGLISPYLATVSDRLRQVLEAARIGVAGFVGFDEAEEAKVARIDPRSILDAVEGLVEVCDCEAVFISCTNLRTLDILERAEALSGLPVLSSNQVLAWHMARLAGAGMPECRPGRLWDVPQATRQPRFGN